MRKTELKNVKRGEFSDWRIQRALLCGCVTNTTEVAANTRVTNMMTCVTGESSAEHVLLRGFLLLKSYSLNAACSVGSTIITKILEI